VIQTKGHYLGFIGGLDGGPLPLLEATEAEIFAILAKTMQMGHYIGTN